MSARSANLLWQQRYRGLAAAAGHCLDEAGRAVLIKPDELERRTYQVLAVEPNGRAAELAAISVETVHKFDAAPDGRLLLGMTTDDIYLWRDGRKLRIAADRRVVYADACLAPGAGSFVTASSDALFQAHAVSLGDAQGRLAWTRDLEVPVNRVAIAGDGQALTIGLQNGTLLCLDPRRSLLWECIQGEAVSALAMPASGRRAAAGTETGSVFVLDEEGGIRWSSPIGLPVVAMAVDTAAEWTAAVLSDGAAHLLVCFDPHGSPAWEHELETAPSGVSLSPSGRHVLVTQANGVAALFAVDFARSAGLLVAGRRDEALTSARSAAETGDLESARRSLLSLLENAPHDVEAAEALTAVELQLVQRLREEAGEHAAAGRWSAALSVLDPAAAVDPWSPDLLRQRSEVRAAAVAAAAATARSLQADRDWEAATAAWTEALALDRGLLEARAALAEIRRARAADLLEAGDAAEAEGDANRAIELWEQARELDPRAELEERLGRAEVERCLAAGIAFYEEGRMAEAQFQLSKAIALDPENETAQRYLGYARGQTGDTLISDRFSRLE